MNKVNVEHWDKVYKDIKNNKICYDLWLDKYKNILETAKDTKIIDLGCGSGNDTLYLLERGYDVLSCDYSEEALNIIKENIKNAETLNLDIARTLPFADDSINVIIADLSLHYFDENTTFKIMNELKRVLREEGYLICRVNSLDDINYQAEDRREIEKHFYSSSDGYKRFFNEDDIRYYFKIFDIEYYKKTIITRYGAEKKCFEVVCTKPAND